jgi:ribosomal protein S18 acetylase RimI-like enzyme
MAKRPPESEDSLKRERAGTYRTRDGRFTVEQSSSGWLLLDAEQSDDLGLPLARGPFATLDAAKAAIADARSGPPPSSGLAPRSGRSAPSARRANLKAVPDAPPARESTGRRARDAGRPAARKAPASRPATPPVVIREIRAVDGDALRALWTAAGFRLLGDDDLGLARLARRNPGLVLVASEGSRIVGSALGTWDGHRGWIYHVVTAPSHRRRGIATRLIDQIEAGLRALGCRKVNVMVRTDSDGGAAFWAARGYEAGTAVQYGRELEPD